MGYGDFQSDTGVSLPTPGIDPNYTDPDKVRQRLLGAMLATHARNMAQQQSAPVPADIQMGDNTLSAMTKLDPDMGQHATSPDMKAFPDPAMGTGPRMDLAHAVLADQPATKYVDQAQGNLDQYQHNVHGWRGMIAPAMLAAASIGGAHSYNGGKLQEEVNTDMNDLMTRRATKEQSLVNQLQGSRQLQQQEYEADQRNRQQDILAAGNNQTKALMAQIAAGSRRDVATTAADSRRDVATTGAESRNYGADKRFEGTVYAADTGAQSRESVARINADAALNRFLAGEQRMDQRQQRGFAHTDLKPTADEDRRADLARAAQGYATRLMEIMQNRPELFGSVGQGAYFLGGRGTQLRNMVGSNDPDVAELKYLKEQLGITQMGAHSMRSAQAISPIADALVNSFNTGPEAGVRVLQNAIKQLDTFTGTQVRPGVVGPGVQQQQAPTLTQQVSGQGDESVGGTIAPARPGARPEFQVTGKKAATAAAAQPGDEYNGYIYLGGDKAKESNWAAVGGR